MSVSMSGRIKQMQCWLTVKNHFLLNASLSTAQETNNSHTDSWFLLWLSDGQPQVFVVCWHCFPSSSLQRKPRALTPLSNPSLSSSVSDGRLSSLQMTKDSGVLSTGNICVSFAQLGDELKYRDISIIHKFLLIHPSLKVLLISSEDQRRKAVSFFRP